MKAEDRWGLHRVGEKDDRSVEELLSRAVKKLPIELEERIRTLEKPLIIECACPGWQPKMWPPLEAYGGRKPPGYEPGGVRYPAVPCTIEQQVREIVEAVRLGCSVAHIHPRDPEDHCLSSKRLDLLTEVYDRIFAEVDCISIQHTWFITEEGKIDYITEAEACLEVGSGNRYCQGAVVLWPPANSYPRDYVSSVQEAVRFMEKNHIKPVHKLRGSYHVRELKRVLIDTKVIKGEPLILVHDMGHPFGWPMDLDPWMPIELVACVEQTKQRIPNSVIGVFSGGRNWLPITMTAILAGVDFVRVGIEDTYWMYPHLDEVIQRNIDCVQKIIDFCRLIGRKVASVDEARRIMGIVRTS